MPVRGASALRFGTEESDHRPVIIAVDDEILVPIGWSRDLRHDFRIIPAANAARALHLLATLERVDMLTVDLHMPVMHGGELLCIAARCFPAVPRILVTGEQDNGAIDALVAATSVSDVLYKPLSSRDLGQYMKAMLSLHVCGRPSLDRSGPSPQVGVPRPPSTDQYY